MVAATSISKPELFDRKFCLVSQQTAVFTPYTVILITVTTKPGVCAWVGHPTCALTIDRCSSPVRHFSRITWHPPSIWMSIVKQNWVQTLIFDELFTVWRNSGETGQLRQTRSCVMNVTWVTTSTAISIHMCSSFAVVIYYCHANSTLISHVTEDCEWCQASLAIWINGVISAYTADVFSYHRTGNSNNWRVDFHFGFYCRQGISCSTDVSSLVWFLYISEKQCTIWEKMRGNRKWRFPIFFPSHCWSQITLRQTRQVDIEANHGSNFLRRTNFEPQKREHHELNCASGMSQNIFCFTDIDPTVVFCHFIDWQGSILHWSSVSRQRTKAFWPRDCWVRLTSSTAGDRDILFLFRHQSIRWQENVRTNLKEIGRKLLFFTSRWKKKNPQKHQQMN